MELEEGNGHTEDGTPAESPKVTTKRQPWLVRSMSTALPTRLSSGLSSLRLPSGSASSFRSVPEPASAKPQLADGEPVWPEHWGITRSQIKDLLSRIRAEPSWHASNNVHTLVHKYIIPWTQGTGCGYALSVNSDSPKEVTVMVSHAWSENAEEFLDVLVRSCTDKEVLFVCALSLYQAEDDAGPNIEEQLGSDPHESPFRRILEHILRRGDDAGWRWRCRRLLGWLPRLCFSASAVLLFLPLAFWDCVPLANVCAAHGDAANAGRRPWVWQALPWWPVWTVLPTCLIIAGICLGWFLARRAYAGRMVVALNREVDIYSRLWCVYEIFVAKQLGIPVEVARTLAAAGKASCRLATCSSQSDTERIQREIEGATTYEAIDAAVYITAHKALWKVALCSFVVGSAIAVFDIAFGLSLPLDPPRGSLLQLAPHRAILFQSVFASWIFASLVVVAKCSAYFAMLSVFSDAQGAPSFREVRQRGGVMTTTGSALFLVAAALIWRGLSGPTVSGVGLAAFIWMGYGLGFWFYGWVLLHYSKFFRSVRALCVIVCCSSAVFLAALLAHLYCSGLLHQSWDALEMRARLYRLVLNVAAGSFGSFFLPTYIFWHAAYWWGIQVTHECADSACEPRGDDSSPSSSGNESRTATFDGNEQV